MDAGAKAVQGQQMFLGAVALIGKHDGRGEKEPGKVNQVEPFPGGAAKSPPREPQDSTPPRLRFLLALQLMI